MYMTIMVTFTKMYMFRKIKFGKKKKVDVSTVLSQEDENEERFSVQK
jgi:hypothetical protein